MYVCIYMCIFICMYMYTYTYMYIYLIQTSYIVDLIFNHFLFISCKGFSAGVFYS